MRCDVGKMCDGGRKEKGGGSKWIEKIFINEPPPCSKPCSLRPSHVDITIPFRCLAWTSLSSSSHDLISFFFSSTGECNEHFS